MRFLSARERRAFLAAVVAGMVGASGVALATVDIRDADGDGVPNAADAYPCDPAAVGSTFYPAQGDHGMLLFEDLWPDNGDLDFNDAVITYNYVFKLDDHGRAIGLRATFNALALGGDHTLGLGLHLPVPRSAARFVTRVVGNGEAEWLTPSEQDAELTLRLSPNLRELFGGESGPINSDPSRPVRVGEPIEVDIVFWDPQPLLVGASPYDLYVFRANDPAHEIHRPEFTGTAAMRSQLFNSGDDGSSVSRSFVNRQGLPFALVFPTLVPYPSEGVEISRLYPDIVGFATSGGANNQDFYVSNVVAAHAYRDVNGQPLPSPRFIGPDHIPAETGCILEWGLAVEWGNERSIFQYGSTVTPEGHAVIAGNTAGGFPGYTNQGGFDLFVGRYDVETGLEMWVRQFGGPGDDVARAVALDAAGNIFVAGQTSSALLGQPAAGGVDAFLLKLSPGGQLVWSRTFGGSGNDTAFGVTVDAAGDVYVTGGSSSASLPGGTHPGNTPASFLVKYDNDGHRLWTQHYRADVTHDSNFSYNMDVAVDPLSGDVFVAGSERRFNRSAQAADNPFIARHRGSDGQLLWVSHLGDFGYRNTSTDMRYGFAFGVAVDDFDGSAYATGHWFAGSSVSRWGEWTRAAGDRSADAWVVKLSPSGSPMWTYTIASVDHEDDLGEAVTVDGLGGTAYFTGRTLGTLPGHYNRGGADYFVASYAYDGTRRWLQQEGTDRWNQGHVAAVRSVSETSGLLYVIGNTAGAFYTTDGMAWDVTFYRHDSNQGTQQHFAYANRLRWQGSEWGACSTSCGSGTRTRTVSCVAGDGTVLADSQCTGVRPPTEEVCQYYGSCFNEWVASDWTACSSTCGAGTRARNVYCRRTDGFLQPDFLCGHQPRPEALESCGGYAGCTYTWETGAWSACQLPGSCLTGAQTRTVLCQRSDGASVEESFCSGGRPAATQACVDPACTAAGSCRQLYEQGVRDSGRYDIDPDGPGGLGTINVYCDMTSHGGGWTNFDFGANRVHLANGHFVQCTAGLTQTASSVRCGAPIFDGDPGRPLYHYLCDGSDRSAHYILEHMGPLLGHRSQQVLGFSSLEQAFNGPTSTGNVEYCYIDGQVVLWSSPQCGAYNGHGNGNCVPGYFVLGL